MARHRSIEVYDTPSGLGGSFTVEIVEDLGERVTVRVWYGRPTANGWERWPEWDGYRFQTTRDKLANRRQMPLFNSRT